MEFLLLVYSQDRLLKNVMEKCKSISVPLISLGALLLEQDTLELISVSFLNVFTAGNKREVLIQKPHYHGDGDLLPNLAPVPGTEI